MNAVEFEQLKRDYERAETALRPASMINTKREAVANALKSLALPRHDPGAISCLEIRLIDGRGQNPAWFNFGPDDRAVLEEFKKFLMLAELALKAEWDRL
jgi:hypothetical protein